MFQNPILPGFHPDPSVCRVGDDYYLVNSTFEYFPGLPVYHSRDLVHWAPIGHVLDRPGQLNLGAASSAGLYAPSIRYHDGTFYVVCTNTTRGGNFVVTATDPAGPWSDPHFLGTPGIDPSLLFDDDGKAYYVGQCGRSPSEYGGDCVIYIQEFDYKNLCVVGERTIVWDGALKRSFWAEGPRLYKIFGYYYLMIAEGGTWFNHSVTVARSKSVLGEYKPCMRNPILTHRHLGEDQPIVNVGHADLIETQTGQWWMVALGCRPIGEGMHCNLGRETFLARVVWDSDLWPVVNPGLGYIPEVSDVSPDLTPCPVPTSPATERFEGDRLPFDWITARTPRTAFYSLLHPGLRLYAQPSSPSDAAHVSLLGRRVCHKSFTAKTVLELKDATAADRAGMVIMQKNTHHFELSVGNGEARFTSVVGGNSETVSKPCPSGKVYLTVKVEGQRYSFYYGSTEDECIPVAENVDGRCLSTESATSFVGLVVGMFASSYGQESTAFADFERFYYSGDDR